MIPKFIIDVLETCSDKENSEEEIFDEENYSEE